MTEFTGYDPLKEDREFIASLGGGNEIMALRGTYQEQTLDPRKLIRTESQGRMGSCAGHSLSSNLEWLYCLATCGQRIQLSRMQAYIMAQDISGIKSDAGSTISAGIQLALKFGLCREELWSYPQSYSRKKPDNWAEVENDSKQHRIGRAIEITTWEQWRTWLGSGQGGIHTGISWGNSMNKTVVDSFSGGGGGHSVAALCLADEKDSNGDPSSWILNSWSESFGSREYPGWQMWTANAVRQMLKHKFTVFVGVSDLPNLKPREYTLETLKKDLRI